MIRYEFKEIRYRSTNFIKKNLINVIPTINFMRNDIKMYIFANLDDINNSIDNY